MAITHPTVKVPGQTLAAVADWNANHVITEPDTPRRAATLIVAAVDSLDTTRADYFCDGVADEVQINQAIAALPATGGRVMLMDGTFDIDASITMNKNNVALVGQGKATRILTDTAIKMVDCATDTDGQLIKDICFYGSKASTAEIVINLDAYHCIIANCWFEHFYYGVKVIEDFNLVTGCIFDDGYYGIQNLGGQYNNFTGNIFDEVTVYAIIIQSGNYNLASSNVFYTCSRGIVLGGSNCAAIGNFSRSGTNVFILIQQPYCTAVGNTGYNDDYMVDLNVNAHYATVSGNTEYTATVYFIRCAADHCSIVGNTCYNVTGTHGIYINAAHGNTISGNTLTKIDQDGIRLNAANHNIVSNNNIHDCSEDANNTYSGILLTGTSTYNVVSNNRISADAANKHKYGIREAAAADDWNCVTGNICTDAVTADISLQGVNDEEAHNIIET